MVYGIIFGPGLAYLLMRLDLSRLYCPQQVPGAHRVTWRACCMPWLMYVIWCQHEVGHAVRAVRAVWTLCERCANAVRTLQHTRALSPPMQDPNS